MDPTEFLLERIARDWSTLMQAAPAFSAGLALSFLIGASGATLLHRERLAHWRDREKLKGDSPTDAARRMRNLRNRITECRAIKLIR
jgi:hypothetical protein